MAFKNAEIRRAYKKEYYKKNRGKILKLQREEYKRNILNYKARWKRKKWKLLLPSEREKLYHYNNEWRKKWQRKQRLECISHYSNGKNSCKCCGENHLEFLAIDHINGGGSKERKEIKKKYYSIYSYLIKTGFPEGYRVLCHNCNLSLGFYGYCPHENGVKVEE